MTFLLFLNTTTGQDLSIDTARCLHYSFLFLNTTTGQDLSIDTARCLHSSYTRMFRPRRQKKSEQQFSEKASAFQSHIFLSVELLMVGIESIAV